MEIKVSNDSGFGNRLYNWECCYEIAKINNAILTCDYPELEFIDLPNTIKIENFNYSSPPENYKPFNSNNIEKDGFILDQKYNHYSTEGFGFSRYFALKQRSEFDFPKKGMKLKDDILSDKIKDIVKNVVGVHIRRGAVPQGGDSTPTTFVKDRYGHPDFWYMSLMDQIVEIIPDVKFYISSNATKQELQSYYDKYDVVTHKDILGYESTHSDLRSWNIYLEHCRTGKMVDTDLAGMVDFFSLIYSKLIICSYSSWSTNAFEVQNTPSIWPEEEHQKIDSLKLNRNSNKERLISVNELFNK